MAGAQQSERSIGSTVVGLAIADGQFRCFWAGDSRGYRIRDEQIVQLTRDHSLVQDLVDAGMLQPDEAADHPNANIITRAVGVAQDLRVDTVTRRRQRGRSVPAGQRRADEAGRRSGAGGGADVQSARRRGRKLIETVLSRGAPDNVSLIITKMI